MSWSWGYEDSDGNAVDPPNAPRGEAFPTQSDAESWLGENWREIRSAGVAGVRLFDAGREVYGPMSLSDP